MGGDTTENAVSLRIRQKIKPLGRLQRHILDWGQDPQSVDVTVDYQNFHSQTLFLFGYIAHPFSSNMHRGQLVNDF